MRCANEHITADGRRINKPAYIQAAPTHPNHLNIGGRVMPTAAQPSHSLLSMQHDHIPGQPVPIPMPQGQPDYDSISGWNQSHYDIPTIDTTYPSHPGSAFGSPQNDNHLAVSPAARGSALNLRDAPLPASFDSNGVSIIARTGPIAASVPTRFGFESSPPTSYHHHESSTIRNLHSSAFGDHKANGGLLGSSPSVSLSEDPVTQPRLLHSQRQSKSRMLSASVGAREMPSSAEEAFEDWDDTLTFEEDLVPNTLQELLTPAERQRRLSRNAEDDSGFSMSHRSAFSGMGTPSEASPKVGSPSGASPSRFGAFFTRQQQKGVDVASESPASQFGVVGSPLRSSNLNPGSSPSLRAVGSRPASGDFFLSSPPRQASASMLSQQLQRTRLSSRASDPATETLKSTLQPPSISRATSTGSIGGPQPGRLDRATSSSSIGVGRDKIDEEPELFAMDELGDSKRESATWKRLSGGSGTWGSGSSGQSKSVGVIGGQRATSNGSNA
jgi:hypothetical protein